MTTICDLAHSWFPPEHEYSFILTWLQVEIFFLVTNEHSMIWPSAPYMGFLPYEECAANIKELGAHLKTVSSSTSTDPFARNSLASTLEQQISGRKSLSDDPCVSTDISCRKLFHQDQDFGLNTKVQRPLEDEKYTNDGQLMLNNPSSKVINYDEQLFMAMVIHI